MQTRDAQGLPDWLYLLIVAALAIYFIIGGIAWAILTYNGIGMPEGFQSILATIAGGLVGILSPIRRGGSPEGRSAG